MNKIALIVAVALLTFACTKKEEPNAGAAASALVPEKSITISSMGETMAFDKTNLYVKSGDDVDLTFKNASTTLKHNWVLTQPGKDNDVGIAGIRVGEAKGFVPDDPAVLAHTKLVDPSGQDKITFKAPPPGDYPYICTNAGHHTVMKGILHSK